MVRAILDGRKTQTRRVLKPQIEHYGDGSWRWETGRKTGMAGAWGSRWSADSEKLLLGECPYGTPGDQLYVRETWKPHSLYAGMKPRDIPRSKIFYRADDAYAPSNTPWVPAIHQPRWASRITLEITGVRVERLQDISEADAIAEGCASFGPNPGGPTDVPTGGAAEAYAWLWDDINGDGAWLDNPWVWVVEFRQLETAVLAPQGAHPHPVSPNGEGAQQIIEDDRKPTELKPSTDQSSNPVETPRGVG